jgi:hypothetical protein
VEADLEWDLVPGLFVGPWAVDLSSDGTQARLRDVETLEGLREIQRDVLGDPGNDGRG